MQTQKMRAASSPPTAAVPIPIPATSPRVKSTGGEVAWLPDVVDVVGMTTGETLGEVAVLGGGPKGLFWVVEDPVVGGIDVVSVIIVVITVVIVLRKELPLLSYLVVGI
jgi:hypothetical protein